ncbi:MAG: hypothetical protein Q9209_002637 [Squamulea sp. 1 TL-2023]
MPYLMLLTYRRYFGNGDPTQKTLRPGLSTWDSVHFWKFRIMRMMILPFVRCIKIIFLISDSSIDDQVLPVMTGSTAAAVVLDTAFPDLEALKKPYIFHGIVWAERVRFLRCNRQVIIGEAEEEKEKMRGIKSETDEDIKKLDKADFLPISDDLLKIRYEQRKDQRYDTPLRMKRTQT